MFNYNIIRNRHCFSYNYLKNFGGTKTVILCAKTLADRQLSKNKMSIPWITLSQSLKNGIEYANAIDSAKFPLLLSRVYNAVQKNVDQAFSEEELQKLEKSLNLQSDQLKLILDSLLYITKRSKNFLMKPTVLHEELSDKLGFNPEKAETFVKFWTESTKVDFDDIQNRQKLEKFSWELNLETSSDCDMKRAIPTSLLQFEIKDSEDKTKNVSVEMNEQQLLELYNQIEMIQNNLDNLNKV